MGTAVTKICDIEVGRTGLGEAAAEAAGFSALSVAVDSTTRAGYYPGAKPIRTKLVAERGTGRLLGAQITGQEGAAKRIDVLAVALWHEMTVEDLLNIDLSYAPPFSPLWDPVLIAARKSWQRIEADRHPAHHRAPPATGPTSHHARHLTAKPRSAHAIEHIEHRAHRAHRAHRGLTDPTAPTRAVPPGHGPALIGVPVATTGGR